MGGLKLDSTNPMHTVVDPFVLNAYGNALVGQNVNTAGEATTKVFSVNVMDELLGMVHTTSGDDPNPYATVYSYNGEKSSLSESSEFTAIDTQWDALSTTALAPDATGAPTISAIVVSSDGDEAIVAEFMEGVDEEYDRYINQYMASMFEANAHTNSSFMTGMALMLASKARQGATLKAKLAIERASRQAMIDVEVARLGLMSKLQWAQMKMAGAQETQTMAMQRFAAFAGYMLNHWTVQRDRYAQDVAYNMQAISWGFQNVMSVAQLLNPIGNAPLGPPQPTRLQEGLALALSNGSNIGMSMGRQFGTGAGIGAGILGAAASFGAALL